MAKFRQKKLDRIPVLKKALREALASTAASLDTVPPDEQITIVAFLSHHNLGRYDGHSHAAHFAGEAEDADRSASQRAGSA